jgi:hypothetical protein
MARRSQMETRPLVAAVGGVSGAILTRLLERAGVTAAASALGVSVVGGLVAVASRGTLRALAGGAAAAGLSELAALWLQMLDERAAEVEGQDPARMEAALEAAYIRAARRLKRTRAVPAQVPPTGDGEVRADDAQRSRAAGTSAAEESAVERPAEMRVSPPERPAGSEAAKEAAREEPVPESEVVAAGGEAAGAAPGGEAEVATDAAPENARPLVIKEPIGAIRFGWGPGGGPSGRAGVVRHPLDAALEPQGR